jgi:hypothetical protein
VTLEKGKGPILGNLRTIQLIEVDMHLLMRILINQRNKESIEKDPRVAKCNYSSRLYYSIKDTLLEKRLVFDNSMINRK